MDDRKMAGVDLSKAGGERREEELAKGGGEAPHTGQAMEGKYATLRSVQSKKGKDADDYGTTQRVIHLPWEDSIA